MGYELNDNCPVILLRVARKLMVGYLTNRKALTVLCSVIKHAGSG